jgi:hypothetical protein
VSRTRDGDTQKLRRRLLGDLDVIVLKALCKEPQRRYASVHDFSEDIRRHLEHLPIKARPSKLTYRASKFLKRHKEAVIPTGIALALFAGLALLLSHSTRPPLAGGNEILLTDFVNSTGDSVFDSTLGQGLAAQLGQSPYLRLASEERDGTTLLGCFASTEPPRNAASSKMKAVAKTTFLSRSLRIILSIFVLL